MTHVARVAWRTALSLVIPATAVIAWEWAAEAGHLQATYFPAPSRILEALLDLIEEGVVFSAARITLVRMTVGWMLAGLIGIGVGCLLGRTTWLRTALWPSLEYLRAIPVAAIVPAGLLLLGVGGSMEITVIVFAAVWPVLINTTAAVAATQPILLDTARVFGFSKLRQIFTIQLPAAGPSILAALRTSLAISLIVAIVAEMLASSGGLGNAIVEARSRYRVADVYAIVLTLGVIGLITNAGLERIERLLTRWQRPPAIDTRAAAEPAARTTVDSRTRATTEE